MLASPYKIIVSRCSGTCHCVTYDILDEDKRENIVNIEVELCDDHAGDVGREEDQDESQDAEQISNFHFPVFLLAVSCSPPCSPPCSPHCVEEADHEVGQPGKGGAAGGGEEDGQGDGADALVGRDLVAHRAGQVNLLAEELLSQQAVQQGDQPDGAQSDFIRNAQLAEVEIALFLLSRGLGLHHGPLVHHRDRQVDAGDLLVRAEHSARHLQPPQPREDGEPGEDEDGPGQDRPGQPEAEDVEHAEGDVGLAGVGRHCVGVVDYRD